MARGPRANAAARRRQQAAEIEARYDAAGTGRRLAGWNPGSHGPKRAVEGAPKVRDRAQDVARNDWAGASSPQKWTTSLVGVGITPRWKDSTLEEEWEKTVPEIDADGVCDAYALQALGVRAWFSGGEVFLRHRPRRVDSPLAAPFQVQLLDSALCPFFDTDSWPNLPQGNKIVQGKEFSKRDGQLQAYWFYREHPGDMPVTPTENDLVRVPASRVSHVFEPKVPGQIRGVSELAPILVRLRASMDVEDAVIDRLRLANLFVSFITRQIPEKVLEGLELDAITGLPKAWLNGKPLAGLQPGLSMELEPGQDVKFANPPEPGVGFGEFMRSTHLGTASGQGLPYELFSGDIKDISDRTLRVIINEFRRFAEQRQWHLVIPKLCRPMTTWWAEAKFIRGDFTFERMQMARRPEWQPHGWEYIHPVQDVQGKVLAINNGLDSRVATIAKRGDSAKKVADDRKLDKSLGLVEDVAATQAKLAQARLDLQAAEFRASLAAREESARAESVRRDAQFEQLRATSAADRARDDAVRAAETRLQGEAMAAATAHAVAVALAGQNAEAAQEAEARRVAAQAAAQERYDQARDAAEARHRGDLESLAARHESALAAAEARHREDVERREQRHAEALAGLQQNIVRLEGLLAEAAMKEVQVVLPDRETTSDIVHGDDGRIVSVKQTERSIN